MMFKKCSNCYWFILRGFNFIKTVYELFDNPSYICLTLSKGDNWIWILIHVHIVHWKWKLSEKYLLNYNVCIYFLSIESFVGHDYIESMYSQQTTTIFFFGIGIQYLIVNMWWILVQTSAVNYVLPSNYTFVICSF